MTRIGAWSARHRRLVIVGWVVLALLAIAGKRLAGAVYTDNLTIPNSSAQTGLDLLRAHDPKAGGYNGQVVFVVKSGTLATDRAAIDQAVENVGRLDHVLSISDPLTKGAVATDGRTAYSAVNFDVNPQTLHQSYVQQVDRAVTPAKRAGVRVLYGGVLGVAAAPKAKDLRAEGIGLFVAVAVLLVAFGSVLAALIPLLSAVLAVMTGLGLLGILAAGVSFGASASTLAAMMGLGVGIDYALFLVTRHRQALIDGDDPDRALRSTLAGSGRSVLAAATTVVLAMFGLYGSGIAFVGKLGLAAAITVACSALAALTLVPALLRAAGEGIDRRHVRRPRAEGGADDGRLWLYTLAVSRHPWRFALGGIVLLAVIAIPTLSLQLGHVGAGSQPKSFSERQAYDALAEAFGPGVNGRLTIVVELGGAGGAGGTATASRESGAANPLAAKLQRALATTSGVASASTLEPSADGALLVGRVTPSTGPSDHATQNLVEKLEDQVLPDALSGSRARGYVTGTIAMTIDFQHTVARRLPLIIAIVVVAAFLLLLVFFRSPVLALKAAVMNMLSIGAAYGVLVAVFQWGWGAGLLGLSGKVPIESYVPMIMFAIVFGLSMDYEVFLVSRIREHWLAGESNRVAVAYGLSRTALVITAAALIMACVFFSFLLSQNVVIKMLALGLGVSVIIDATVIRLVVVPSLMFLFGGANWWIPGWLDRLLPRIGE